MNELAYSFACPEQQHDNPKVAIVSTIVRQEVVNYIDCKLTLYYKSLTGELSNTKAPGYFDSIVNPLESTLLRLLLE